MWLAVHLFYITGFKNQVTALLHWAVTFLGNDRSERTATEQQIFARRRSSGFRRGHRAGQRTRRCRPARSSKASARRRPGSPTPVLGAKRPGQSEHVTRFRHVGARLVPRSGARCPTTGVRAADAPLTRTRRRLPARGELLAGPARQDEEALRLDGDLAVGVAQLALDDRLDAGDVESIQAAAEQAPSAVGLR